MQPKIGQILHIHIVTVDEAERKEQFKSRIVDMDEETIIMELPIHEQSGRLKRLYAGDHIYAHFFTEGGVKNFFHTHVTGFDEDPLYRLIAIRRPASDDITRVQRRSFLRVPAELEVAVKTGPLHFVAVTADLSGGGFAFKCDAHYPLERGQILSCWLLLHFRGGQIDHAPFKAEIVRTKPLAEEEQLIMLKFVDIQETDQQKVVRYCLERQMDFRKV